MDAAIQPHQAASNGTVSRLLAWHAVFWILRDVTWPALRRHRLRSVLTLLGVVIGVQLFVAIQLINRATIRSFEHTFETIAGGADLQVSNGELGVPEDLVERLASVAGVASASGLVRGTLRTSSGVLTVFGVDLLADQRLREMQFPRRYVHIGDELRFANAVDSIALSRSFAAEAKLEEGDGFETIGPTGSTRLIVRGSLDPVGPATLFGGAVGLVDLPNAQRLLARSGRVDEIAVAFADGADRLATRRRLEAVIGGAGALMDPSERAGGFAGLLGNLRGILVITSVLGFTVGSFLVHHAIRSAVLQRRRAFALARALGYRRGTVAGAIFAEATLFGALGGGLGALLALGAARLAIDAVTGAIAAIWVRGDRATVDLGLGDVGLAVMVGVASALLAAVGPALSAVRLDVVAQLRSTAERRRSKLGRSTIVLGLVCCGLAFTLLRSGGWWASSGLQVAAFSAGSMTMTMGMGVLAPVLLGALMAPIRRFTRRGGLMASLAAGNLTRDPVRCRGTLGALMAAFGFVLCVSAFVNSLGGTILAWIDQALAADLYVGATSELPLPSAPTLPGAIEGVLRAIPDVTGVAPTRMVLAPVAGRTIALKAQPVGHLRMRPFPVVQQTAGDYVAPFARGEAVLMSDNLAFHLGLHAGDRVALDSPSGRRDFLISAVILDYTMDVGSLTIESDVYRRLWGDDQVTTFLVYLAPGADAARVRSAILAGVDQRTPINVLTAGEFKRNITAAIDGAFALTYAIQLVATVIAGIGVLSFFLAEVVDRRREIGLLRTVALDRRQLLGTFTIEAALIGVVGGLLAIVWGWPVAYVIVTHSTRMLSGWQLGFTFPWLMALLTPIVVAATAACAAQLPARGIARSPLGRLVGIE